MSIGVSSPGVAQVIALRQQVLGKSDALRALRDAQGAENASAPGVKNATEKTEGFAGKLDDALKSVNETQANAAKITEAYERGEVTDVTQVMLARQEAGIAFEATLQVRNKLLNAYQDIMRMGV